MIRWGLGLLKRFFADPYRPLRVSAVLTMIGLVLMVWSLAQPTPLPVMIAFTVGQGIGTLAFVLYLAVIVLDIRSRMVDKRGAGAPPTSDEPTP